jgi:hypothetical protein
LGRKVNGKRHEGEADRPHGTALTVLRGAGQLPEHHRHAPISIRLSRAKPAKATHLAHQAGMASTSTPTTFQDRVSTSSAWPRQSYCLRVAV